MRRGPGRRRGGVRRGAVRARAAHRARAEPGRGGRGGARRLPPGQCQPGRGRARDHGLCPAHRDADGGQVAGDSRARCPLPGPGRSGFDIAGAEAGWPPSRHLDAFQFIKRENFHITIHAGEAFGLPSIWEAVQWCGTERLGHGVRIVDDIQISSEGNVRLGRLAAYIRDRRIPLEMCPTSNVQTGAAPSIAQHPIRLLRQLSFRVTVNTDNRLMSQVTLSSEFHRLAAEFGYGWSDIEWLTVNAMKSAFAGFDERLHLINTIIKPGFATARAMSDAVVPVSMLGARHPRIKPIIIPNGPGFSSSTAVTIRTKALPLAERFGMIEAGHCSERPGSGEGRDNAAVGTGTTCRGNPADRETPPGRHRPGRKHRPWETLRRWDPERIGPYVVLGRLGSGVDGPGVPGSFGGGTAGRGQDDQGGAGRGSRLPAPVRAGSGGRAEGERRLHRRGRRGRPGGRPALAGHGVRPGALAGPAGDWPAARCR